MSTPVLIKGGPRVASGLVTCRYCEQGFRRVEGHHIGSQRLGMIPTTQCDRVFVVRGTGLASNGRRWVAYVDGDVVRAPGGDPRFFATPKAAYTAACKAAPRMWHP